MLYKKHIKLKCIEDGVLSYDYFYSLQIEIYKKIMYIDSEFGEWLHNKGYIADNKRYKLMNFALLFDNNKMTAKGIELTKDEYITLVVSGHKDVLNKIINGIMMDDRLNICNVSFVQTSIENDTKVRFNKINIYHVQTPLCESIWDNGIVRLNYFDKRYCDAIKQNLKRKYEAVYGKEYEGELKIMIEDLFKVKEKTIKVKNGIINGYCKFEILIQADKDMQKVAYYLGLGEKTSLGAGFLRYLTGGE